MIKFQAFGDQESYSEDSDEPSNQITREAQEEILNKLYYDALQAASKGDQDEAIELLSELKDRLESGNCIVHDTVHLARLKYLTYKNIGIFANDIKSILQALEIDSSDFNLWVSAGRKAKEECQFFVSKHCFETAFKQNSQNIIVIDNLIEVYYICNEYYNCANMCLHALKQDSQYHKALILFNECLSFDRMLIKDLDSDFMEFTSRKYGGKVNMEELLKNSKFDSYKSNLIKGLRKSQSELFKPCIGEDVPIKRKEFVLKSKDCASLAEISKLILGFYEQIQEEGLSICSKIAFEEEEIPMETVIVEEEPKKAEEPPPQEPVIQAESSDSQPQKKDSDDLAEFVDKRRSTRNKRVTAAAEVVEQKSDFEKLLDLFPGSLKGLSTSPIMSKESSQASNFSKIHKAENDALTKVFLQELSEEFKLRGDRLNIYQLIRFYLIKFSSYKNFIIPEEFKKLYKIYRDFEPIPASYGTRIPQDISLEMINVILTANELLYNEIETSFLQEMMGVLGLAMEQTDFRQFIVRLQVILGNAKWDSDHLQYARDLCTAKPEYDYVFGMDIPEGGEEIQVATSNQGQIDISYLDNAIEMLSFTSGDEKYIHFKEIIRAYFTKAESNLHKENKNELCEAIVALEIWEKGINLIDSWHDLTDKCYEVIYFSVVENKIRITPNLAKKVAKKAIDGHSIDLWKILEHVLEQESCDVQTMASFYTLAHTSLGKNGLCTLDGGHFLLRACDTFQNADFEPEAESAYACLFDYPPKRKEHNCLEVPLEWKHCKDLLNFSLVEEPSDYDSKTTITQEEKDLLMRMLRLIPPEATPIKCSEYVRNHIYRGDKLDDEYQKLAPPTNDVTLYIYYYLADYFFKSKKEFNEAKRFYLFDLALNFNRFDSWAGLALSISFEIDEMLVNCNPNFEEYVKKVFSVNQCYEQALKLKNCTKLRTEKGLLFYSFANFVSRNKKMATMFKSPVYDAPNFDNPKLKQMLNYEFVLGKAKECFEILSVEDPDEPWLVYYMLGKVSEKNVANILQTLQYYEYSAQLLYLDGANYPKKVQYVNNTRVPHLSVEALEIHYRIHSAVLKYLNRTFKFSARNLRKIKLYLVNIQKSPFMIRRQYSEKKAKHVDDDCEAQVKDCLSDLLDIVQERETAFDVNQYRRELIQMCRKGVLKCLERFPNHYKSYYRFSEDVDPKTVMGLLAGNIQSNRQIPALHLPSDGKKNTVSVIPGLFCFEREVFSNVYRLPVGDEIERSGKFSAHMFRLVYRLLETAHKLEDLGTLQSMFLFLQKSPPPEKRFLNETERKALGQKSEELKKMIVKGYITRMSNGQMSTEEAQRLYIKYPFLFHNNK